MEDSRYKRGGYMANGGELKQGDKIVILGTEYDFVKYETDTSQGYEEERIVLKNEDGIRSYPKDMVEAYSNYKMANGGETEAKGGEVKVFNVGDKVIYAPNGKFFRVIDQTIKKE